MRLFFILVLPFLSTLASAQNLQTYTPTISGQLSLKIAVNFYKQAGMNYRGPVEHQFLDAYGIDCRATSIPTFQFKCTFYTDAEKTNLKKFTGEPARVLYLAVVQGMKEFNPYFPQCPSEKCKMTMSHLHWQDEAGNPWGHATFYHLFIGNDQ